MFLSLFLKGFIIGFSIAMPVGPIGLLCMRNTLALGFLGGALSGLGAACADFLFGGLAGLGIASVNIFLENNSLLVHSIGALFLGGIGIQIYRKSNSIYLKQKKEVPLKGLLFAFFSTFFLTLINPLTILSYAAIYAAVATDIVQIPGLPSCLTVAFGVFLGSALWWLILSCITSCIHRKLEHKHLVRINQISGVFLILLGIATWVSAFV